MCAAQLLSIQQNAALFSLLGTYYGGNGTTNFALPDLRGRYPMSQGNGPGLSPRVMGEVAGTQTVTMLQSNLPVHNHLMMVNNTTAAVSTPASNALSQGPVVGSANINVYGTTSAAGVMSPLSLTSSGGGQPFSVMQPYNTVNYIIALSGIYPSRN